jgi:predicted PilT family ATPase
MQNKDVDVYIDDDFILTAKAGKTGVIKIKKDNNVGRLIMREINRGGKVRLLV